jgi:hypothetical protein
MRRALCRTRTGDPFLTINARGAAACCRLCEMPAASAFRRRRRRAAVTGRRGLALPRRFHTSLITGLAGRLRRRVHLGTECLERERVYLREGRQRRDRVAQHVERDAHVTASVACCIHSPASGPEGVRAGQPLAVAVRKPLDFAYARCTQRSSACRTAAPCRFATADRAPAGGHAQPVAARLGAGVELDDVAGAVSAAREWRARRRGPRCPRCPVGRLHARRLAVRPDAVEFTQARRARMSGLGRHAMTTCAVYRVPSTSIALPGQPSGAAQEADPWSLS